MENRNTVIPIGAGRRFWSFCYPHQLVADPNIAIEDKRAILAAWASDANAVESLPTLRHLPGTPFPVTYSAIMTARAQLDRLAGGDDEPLPPPPGTTKRFRTGFKEAA